MSDECRDCNSQLVQRQKTRLFIKQCFISFCMFDMGATKESSSFINIPTQLLTASSGIEFSFLHPESKRQNKIDREYRICKHDNLFKRIAINDRLTQTVISNRTVTETSNIRTLGHSLVAVN